MTVYLWHNIAIAAIWPVLTVLTLDDLGYLDHPVDLVASLLFTLLATVAFGWVEDLAARRRPQLWPRGGPGPRSGPVRATVGEPLSEPPGPADPPPPRPTPAVPAVPEIAATRPRKLGSPMAPSLPTGWGQATPRPATGPVDHRNGELSDGPRHAAWGTGEAVQAPWSPATRGHDAQDDPAPQAWFASGTDRS